MSSPTYQSEWEDQSVPHWFYQDLAELHRQKREKQATLIGGLPTSCAQALHTHGIWMKHNVLPKEFFKRLKFEAFDYFVGQRDKNKRLLSNWHKSQSFTLPLHYTNLLRQPFLQSAITDCFIPMPLQYAAGRKAKPEYELEAMAQCAPSFAFGADKNSSAPFAIDHNAETPGATALLFLENITAEDGTLFYIPGSHRMTESRIYWEYQRRLEEENQEEEYEVPMTRLSDLQELDLPPLLPLAR
nr:hypothetical protein [uncultured bacterium]